MRPYTTNTLVIDKKYKPRSRLKTFWLKTIIFFLPFKHRFERCHLCGKAFKQEAQFSNFGLLTPEMMAHFIANHSEFFKRG